MSNFSAVLSMFVTALSAAVFTRLVGRCAGGGLFQKCGGASVNEETALLEGFSPVKTGKTAKGQRRYTPTEASSHQGHKTNDRQQ